MMNGLDSQCEEWRFSDDPPVAAWNERIVLGSRLFEDIASDPAPRRALRTLLVGHSHDPDLLRIATQLSQAGAAVEVFLVDRVSRLPTLELSATGHGRQYDVGYCRAFRPEQFIHFHFDRTLRRDDDWSAIDSSLAGHAASQSRCLMWSWLTQVSVSRWVNSPWNLRDAENKLTQLTYAQQVGLVIPPTLVTSEVDQLRRFAKTCTTGVVHKSLGSPVVSLHDHGGRFLYTSPIVADDIDCLPYPCLFQQRLIPRAEHRVTVIGRRTFTASLHRTGAQQADWRRAAVDHQRFEHHELPEPLVAALRELMDALHIQIGAVDLIETGDQTYFLEVNPSAALIWLERALGMHLCQSVTNLILCGA